jgi:hypothetical protein
MMRVPLPDLQARSERMLHTELSGGLFEQFGGRDVESLLIRSS